MLLSILLACQPTIHHQNVGVDHIDQEEDTKESVEEGIFEEDETSESRCG